MKIVSYLKLDGDVRPGLVREDGNGVIDLLRAIEAYAAVHGREISYMGDILDLIDEGFLDIDVLAELSDFVDGHNLLDELTEQAEYVFVAPIPRPRAIYALGRNYPAHAKESGVDVPSEPVVFPKAVTAVIGPDDGVVYKNWLTRVDPEAELAVVIGKFGANIPLEEAADYILGYTALNDVTARDLQNADFEKAHPWLRSKGIDTFCPMGPVMVLTDEISLPVELDVQLFVNGQLRQSDNTRNLTFDIPHIISWISKYHTLYPGDIISTGTPEGMAPVVVGDVMEVVVEKIGTLRNMVVAEEE